MLFEAFIMCEALHWAYRILFKCQNNYLREIIVLSPFYVWENWDTEMLINLPKLIRLPSNWIDSIDSFNKHLWSIYYLPDTLGYCCISDKQNKVPAFREVVMLGWTGQRENKGERYWALCTTEFQYFKSYFHRKLFKTVIKKMSKEVWLARSMYSNPSETMSQWSTFPCSLTNDFLSYILCVYALREGFRSWQTYKQKRGAVTRADRPRGPPWPHGENTETIRELQVLTKATKQQRILPPWSISCRQKSGTVVLKINN